MLLTNIKLNAILQPKSRKQLKGGQDYEIFALVALYKQSFAPQKEREILILKKRFKVIRNKFIRRYIMFIYDRLNEFDEAEGVTAFSYVVLNCGRDF